MTKLELNAGYGRPVDKLVFTGIAARLGRSVIIYCGMRNTRNFLWKI
jgi:hypothetical protein